jgi:hypothetical protein
VANNKGSNNFSLTTVAFTSQGYNLSNAWNGLTLQATDRTSDPRVASLANSGGVIWTHALLLGSPALDQIPYGVNGCGTIFTADQRGMPRPFGDKCDIGAYESYARYTYLPVAIK